MDRKSSRFTGRPAIAAALLLLSSLAVAVPSGCSSHAPGGEGPAGESVGRSAQAINAGPTGPDHEWSFDESSGTAAADTGAVGGAGGTLGSAVTHITPGDIGPGAVNLPGGSNSSVGLGAVGTVGTADFTAIYWVRSSQSNTAELLGNRSCTSACNFWGMRASSTTVSFEIYQDGSQTNGAAPSVSMNVRDGQWHRIAARRRGTLVTLFVDGSSDTVTAAGVANITTTTALSFGNNPVAVGLGSTYVGDLDELRLYSRALSDCEILGDCAGGVHVWALDEASGTTATDQGNPGGDNGTLGSSVTRLAPGHVGAGAATLAGDTNSVLSFGNAGLVGTNDFTATYWVRSAQTGTAELLGNRQCSSACNFWGMRASSAGVSLEMYQDGSGTNGAGINIPTNTKDGAWHFIAARRSGTSVTLFVDGSSKSATTTAPTDITTTTPLTFGRNPVSASFATAYVGDVDDIRLYDRALSDCEITGTCAGPDHAWPLDEASGTTAIDDGTPGGVNGTLGSGVTRLSPGRLGAGAATLPGTSAASVISFGATGTVGTSDFTATYWMRSSQSGSAELLGNRACSSACNFWGMRAISAGVSLEMYQDASQTNGAATSLANNVRDGQWHFIAARRKGKTVTLFVDSSSASNTAAGVANITTTTPLTFGYNPAAAGLGTAYVGDVDEIRLYGRALDDCEILGTACTAPGGGCSSAESCDELTGLCSGLQAVADGTSCTGGTCLAGACVLEAGAEAGVDAGAEAGVDASVEAGTEAGTDGASEAAVDGEIEADASDGSATAVEAGLDATPDSANDDGSAAEAGAPDGGADASADAAAEASSPEAGVADAVAPDAENADAAADGPGLASEAGTQADGGDAGSAGPADASSSDGSGDDAGEDAALDGGPRGFAGSSSGCGCETAGSVPGHGTSLLGVAPLLVLAFRRRSRSNVNAATSRERAGTRGRSPRCRS